MATDHTREFTDLVKGGGVPVTEAEIKTKWDELVVAADLQVKNPSPYSPFWRFVDAAATKAVMWLVQLLITIVIPNFFLKTAKGVMLEIIAWAYGITRKLAGKTRGHITFNRTETAGTLDVAAGAIIQSPVINGVVYQVKTLAFAQFPDGDNSIDVLCEAVIEGRAHNLASGYYTIMKTPIAGVSSVINGDGWITVPGTDVEKDDELRNRARNQFNTVAGYHIDAVYRSIISQFPGVLIENIYFEHDAPRGPGTANAFVLFEQEAPAVEYVAAINDYITGELYHGHGDDIQVFVMPEAGQDIVLDWWPRDTLDTPEADALEANIDNFIRAAFRENTGYTPTLTHPSDLFSFSQLAGELHDEFPGIKTLVFTNADIVSTLNIPVIDTLLITRH